MVNGEMFSLLRSKIRRRRRGKRRTEEGQGEVEAEAEAEKEEEGEEEEENDKGVLFCYFHITCSTQILESTIRYQSINQSQIVEEEV